jgi:hypothetical protein
MEINSIDLPKMRIKLTKCKIIVLTEMGTDPLLNVKYLQKSEREQLLLRVREIFDNATDDFIENRFNEICNEKLFNSTSDVNKYPTYIDSRFPEQQQKIDDEETSFLQLREDIKTNKLMDIAGNVIETNN